MRVALPVLAAIAAVFSLVSEVHSAPSLSAQEIVARMLEADPWGLSGAEVSAVATVRNQNGSTKVIRFSSRSRRIDKNLSKGLVRVTAPADLKGVGLLQIQKKTGDDERHLFLPELKRARRIVGSSRSGSFVGTDFSYGDMDRKDVRYARAELKGEEKLGSYQTYHLELWPTDKDALYARIETWARTDNFVPLKSLMYARSGALVKTFTAKEIKRVSGNWFITRSLMVSENERRSTELQLESVTINDKIGDDEFTVQNLERL